MSVPSLPPGQSGSTPPDVANEALRLPPINQIYHADHWHPANGHLLTKSAPLKLVYDVQQQQRAQVRVPQPIQLQQRQQHERHTEEEEEREDDEEPEGRVGSPVGPSDEQAAMAITDQGNGSGAPKRKRRRQAISCTECRRRKIRCDRERPCGACVRQGVVCNFVVIQPFELSVTRPEYDEMRRRIACLEALITPLAGATAANGSTVAPEYDEMRRRIACLEALITPVAGATAAIGSTPVPLYTAAPLRAPDSSASHGSVGPRVCAYYYFAPPPGYYHYGPPPPPPPPAHAAYYYRDEVHHARDAHHAHHHHYAYPAFPPQEHLRRKVPGPSLTPADDHYARGPSSHPPPPPLVPRHERDSPSPSPASPSNKRSRPLQSMSPPHHYKPSEGSPPKSDSEFDEPDAAPSWTVLSEPASDERAHKRRRVDTTLQPSPLPPEQRPRPSQEAPKSVTVN